MALPAPTCHAYLSILTLWYWILAGSRWRTTAPYLIDYSASGMLDNTTYSAATETGKGKRWTVQPKGTSGAELWGLEDQRSFWAVHWKLDQRKIAAG